jgi:hypothetical protein
MEWLHRLLGGSSPITGYLGSMIMALDVINQVIVEQGPPHDLHGWIVFLGAFFTGLSIRLAKDANKSNAPNPTVVPTLTPKL